MPEGQPSHKVADVAKVVASTQVVATMRVGAVVMGTIKCTSPEGFPEKDPIPTLDESVVDPHVKVL
jgi:hypothetical protein